MVDCPSHRSTFGGLRNQFLDFRNGRNRHIFRNRRQLTTSNPRSGTVVTPDPSIVQPEPGWSWSGCYLGLGTTPSYRYTEQYKFLMKMENALNTTYEPYPIDHYSVGKNSCPKYPSTYSCMRIRRLFGRFSVIKTKSSWQNLEFFF